MKKALFSVFLCLIVLLHISADIYAQVSIGPVRAKCGMDIYRNSTSVLSHGVFSNDPYSYLFKVGKTSSVKERAILQWNIPDDLIPDGSTVTSVTLWLRYGASSDSSEPYLEFFNVGKDIENFQNLDTLWAKTDPVPIEGIGKIMGGYTKDNSSIEVGFAEGSAFAKAIEASLASNKFTLGMAWSSEALEGYRDWNINSAAYLTITYLPKQQALTVDQKLSNGTSYGSIGHYEGSAFQTYPVPKTFTFDVNSIQLFRADTNKAATVDEKFNSWDVNSDVINHKSIKIEDGMKGLTAKFKEIGSATITNALEGILSVTGDLIDFKDPWLRDDNSDLKGLRNRGTAALWHSYYSPLFQDKSNPKSKGIFIDQSGNTSNYYSVRAKQTIDTYLSQTGKTHRFYFQNWTATNAEVASPSSLETPVIFRAPNAEVNANYKASLLSSQSTAMAYNGQRKFIRTSDGYLHLVYESMGKIWYERSGDNGTTWVIQNNGRPINTDYVRSENGTVTGTGAYTTAKEPAIDYMNNNVVIVWQEQSGANYVIRLAVFSNGQHVYPINNSPLNCIPFPTYGQYTEDTTPQIAIKDNSYAVIAIRRNDAYAKGIECHLVLLNAPGGVASNETQGIIPGTDGYSSNFTLSTDRCYTNKYHIAWQQDDGYTSRLNYAKIHFNWVTNSGPVYVRSSSGQDMAPGDPGYWEMQTDETVNITDNIYCAAAYAPSMISAENGTARMAFKGYTEDGEYYLMFVNPDDLSWVPYLNKYGGEIFSPQVSSGSETYYVGWTEPVGSSYKTVCTDSYTLRNMETVNNSSGRDIQINLGGTRSERFSMGFNSERGSAPYSFTRSEAIGTIQVNKSTPISNGRAVVINKDKAQLYFILGNVKSEGVNIDFVKAEDTLRLRGDLKKVNRFLVSKPFTLKDNSAFSFALRYGTSDSLKSRGYFDKKDAFTSFKLELVDAQSGERLGSYINEKMNKDNLFTKKEASFKVSSEGLGTSRLVSLRLSVDENTPSEYTISDMILGKGLSLSKSLEEKEVSYKGEAAVKEFSLDQNFPNPFNPATVINYALPKASFVTLKVYDVLGKEVTTLVNGYKAEGRYSVQFNASYLPSGIYIYQITAGSNVVSKKMMLVK